MQMRIAVPGEVKYGRRQHHRTAVHVVAFTFVGSVLGGLVGSLFGPDIAVTMVVTLGLAAGLARLLLRPFERRTDLSRLRRR